MGLLKFLGGLCLFNAAQNALDAIHQEVTLQARTDELNAKCKELTERTRKVIKEGYAVIENNRLKMLELEKKFLKDKDKVMSDPDPTDRNDPVIKAHFRFMEKELKNFHKYQRSIGNEK